MTHLSENSQPLAIQHHIIDAKHTLHNLAQGFNDVLVIVLPAHAERTTLPGVGRLIARIADKLGEQATLITIGETVDLVHVHADIAETMQYHHWIAIKRTTLMYHPHQLPHHHFGALIHTKYRKSLQHTKTRIKYTYCPACGKTTKDYGGKKHTYHEYGTLMSDVWRDITGDLNGDISSVITRFSDLFGIETYRTLLFADCRTLNFDALEISANKIEETALQYTIVPSLPQKPTHSLVSHLPQTNIILQGDSLEHLQTIPNNSIDFIFTDPPYNLGKKYNTYNDSLEIQTYFEWCDQWLSELARVLKPGRTLAVLNIPLWSIRHFLHLETILTFQNWIAWDALSFPVRKIMPAHYTILTFSKGEPRPQPGLTDPAPEATPQILSPLAEGFCLRKNCIKARKVTAINDRGQLTDLWWDIHRLKHNSRRVDHPTQLPPNLLYRLISIFTQPNEIVLDCFNGAGTTTLAAHQLGRQYIGIEKSEKYCTIARQRHEEIGFGLDPFRKARRTLTAKNSRVPRLPKQKYAVSKKTLQLEVRRIAQMLDKLPTRAEVEKYGQYPIKYYDDYFVSWGEVCAAARNSGMTETPTNTNSASKKNPQLKFKLDDT